MNELIKNQPLQTMVDNYNAAVNEISRAFQLFESARKRVTECFGENFHVIDRIRDYDIRDSTRISNETTDSLKKGAWHSIARKMQIDAFMTENRKSEFNKQISDGNVPDFTVENILNFYESFAGNINTLLEETVKEAFEFLRPRNSGYKTNSEYEIGKKVILKQYCNDTLRYVDSHSEIELTCIDNVFHLLDGKGVSKYPNTLKTIINDGLRSGRDGATTEYFKVKWYRSSATIHIEFIRKDLLDKLNAIGGGNRLKNT